VIMPDDHFLAPPQVTATDDQFGTHTQDGFSWARRSTSLRISPVIGGLA
jgi:hypothetical protein